MIPKVIHYCWLGEDPYPAKVQRCMDSWKKNLPGWEFRLWDKSCVDETGSSWVKEAYEAKVYSHAADYIRLWAVWKYGGVYFDSDVEVLKDFSPFLHLPYFMGEENGSGNIEAAVFGAEAGNPLIKKCLDFYQDRHFKNPDGSVKIKLTVPDIMREKLEPLRIIMSIEEFNKDDALTQVFHRSYFSPKAYNELKATALTPHTYSIHHFRGSWMPLTSRIGKILFKLSGDKFYKIYLPVYKMLFKRKQTEQK